ncbi:MAG: hypothetical protein ABNG98_01550 [Flavobacterium sp.]|jgi:hypothetical protein
MNLKKIYLALFLLIGLQSFSQEKPKELKFYRIELTNGDIIVVDNNTHIKFPGYPTLALNTMKIDYDGVKIKDNITFFKNTDTSLFKKIEITPGPNGTIQKIKIKTK